MTVVRYLTHPQVQIDPDIPVAEWSVNEVGRARIEALVQSGSFQSTTRIISSAETKAVQTAQPLAVALGLVLEINTDMHENDRSATGYLPSKEFELVASDFFANPSMSVRGWERAVDAQKRIVRQVEAVLEHERPGDILFVGHGAVGTLLLCHYWNVSISRIHDQPTGGGHFFAFINETRRVLHGWKRIEECLPI